MNIDRRRVAATIIAAMLLLAPPSRGQQPSSSDPPAEPQPMLDHSMEAAEGELPQIEKSRKLIHWNEYEGPYITLKFGVAGMLDYGVFSQDEDNELQVGTIDPGYKVRDFRLLFSGRFPKLDREVTWKTGIMYDGAQGKWLVRETGLIVAVPEMWGHLFIGRTKEGTSLTKHMVGFSVWGLERSPMHDAAIPIMVDGIRWMGYRTKRNVVWNLAYFDQTITESRTYPYYDRQVAGRVAWLPAVSFDGGKLMHIGMSFRYGNPQNGEMQLRAKPEATTAPNFVDTGKFPAEHSTMIGPEAYYRNGRFLIGSEYYFLKADSPSTGNPLFHGGDVVATYTFTGEARPYSTKGAVFGFLPVNGSVFRGGKGAWEGILRFSYIDTDDGTIRGGKNWRISPLLAWHLSDEIRWTIGYGYDVLDRSGEKGSTHIFQSRVSLMF